MSLTRDTISLTPAEQAALDLIKSGDAVAKVIMDYSFVDENNQHVKDYSSIDFIFDQIVDPTTNRPSRSAHFFKELLSQPCPETLKKMNLITQKVHEHHPGQNRNTKHKDVTYQHTLKTSVSLLPYEPAYMNVFDDDAIGFIWNRKKCNLKKGKYAFAKNAGTNGCFWFTEYAYSDDDREPVVTQDDIQSLQKQAIDAKKPIDWNEILAGLPLGELDAVFAPRDEREMRLRAWDAMLYVKQKLKLEGDLPVLVIQSAETMDNEGNRIPREPVFRVYTAAEREADLKASLYQGVEPSLSKMSLFAVENQEAVVQPLTELQTHLNRGLVGF